MVWKEWLELRKNPAMLASMAALPVVLVVVPMGIIYAYVRNPNDPNLRALALYYDLNIDAQQAARFLIEKVIADWLALFLMMPTFIPVLMSAHAIAGEKEKRTLEPLLSAPITAMEIVIGKSIASLIPALGLCVLAFALLCFGIDWLTWPVMHELLLPNSMWMFGLLVISPLLAFFGNGVAVLISARVGDSRLAQQLAGLFVLPLVGLAGAQFAGWLRSGIASYAVLGVIVLIFDVAVLWAVPRFFDRERLLSRWG